MDRGDKNHIEHEAILVNWWLLSIGLCDKHSIIEKIAPPTTTIKGIILYCRGRKISCSRGKNNHLMQHPLKIAPIVSSMAGMEMSVSRSEILWVG